MTAIRLGLLGGFELSRADGETLTIAMRKAKALVAWLGLRPGEPQTRERLAGLLWAESGEAAARHSLRQALSVLRRTLPDADRLLRSDGDRILLEREGLDCDVFRFCELAQSQDPRALDGAAALYRGEFLEGFSARAPEFEDWMLAERSRLRELAGGVLARLLDHFKTAGDWEKALRAALGLVALEPLRESIQRETMSLEVLLGRPAEALRRYRACEATLQRELGIQPEAATRALYRSILAERRQGSPAVAPERASASPHRAAQLAPQSSSGAAPPDTDLLGREAELCQFAGLLDTCLEAGIGATLLLRGEAGIGKSALAEAAARLGLFRGCVVHRITLFEPGTDAPSASAVMLVRELLDTPISGPVSDLQRSLVDADVASQDSLLVLDALGLRLDPESIAFLQAIELGERRAGLLRALSALLVRAARQSPRLLLVEDLHWADTAFALLLAGLAGAASGVPVLMLLTSRHGGEPLDPAWRAAMRGAPLSTLDLGPLRPDAAITLARRAGAEELSWARRCAERAAGNPLFLEHLVRAGPDLGEAVPASVQGLVERRLSGLSAADQRTAQAASVLGVRFSGAALDALLGNVVEPCRALCGSGLLTRDGDWYQFGHALVRDGIHASIPDPARRALHRKAAAWYEGRDASLQADHLAQGGDPRAPSVCLKAAREGREAHRYDAAIGLARRARELAEGPTQRAEAGLLLAAMHSDRGEIPAARRCLEEVIAEAPEGGARCDARIALAGALLVQDAYGEAMAQLEVAEPCALQSGSDDRMAKLFYHRGNACFSLGRLDDCMAAHAKALEHARAVCETEMEARALSGLGDAYYQRGRMVTAHHYYDRCVRLCQAHGLLRVQAPNLAGRAMCALYLNRLEDAVNDATASSRLASLTHNRRDECLARNVLGIVVFQAGDRRRAEEESEAGLVIARAVGLRRFEADHLSLLGAAKSVLGRVPEGRADLEAAWALVKDRDMAYAGPWVLGFLAQFEEDPSRRARYLEWGEAALTRDSVSHNHLQFRQCALGIALAESDRAAMEHHASALAEYTAGEPLPWSDLQVAGARALLAWKMGERGVGAARRLKALASEARSAGLSRLADTLSSGLASCELSSGGADVFQPSNKSART